MPVRILGLIILIALVGACSRGDALTPTVIVVPTAVPTATATSILESTPSPTATSVISVDPTISSGPDRVAVLLPAIDLPAVISGISGCNPRPRFSGNGGGGTVPWPTPVGTSGQDSEISEIELAVFSGVAHRVVEDFVSWTEQVAIDSEMLGSSGDIRELGWVLATSVVPMCEAMALAPWPEKYESETAPVAELLVDASVLGREMFSDELSDSISGYMPRIQSLVTRSQEMANTFGGMRLSSVATGSESVGFFVEIPPGWHVTKIVGALRIVADFDSQLAFLSSSEEQALAGSAGLNVRTLRNVPGSEESQWITNGELMFPGYRLDGDRAGGLTLVSPAAGLTARVRIEPRDSKIYYIQSICSDTDATCNEFVDSLSEAADYR